MKQFTQTGDGLEHSGHVSEPSYRLAYSAKEAASMLGGISVRSLRRLEARGLLPRPSRGLRKKLYLHSDLVAYLETSK